MSRWRWFAWGFLLGLVCVSSASAEETEAQRLIKKLLAPPKIQTEAGFTAKLHRVTPEGQLQLVASGFINPLGLRFIDKSVWVTDVNGDFIGGMRELPDGFIVEISAR